MPARTANKELFKRTTDALEFGDFTRLEEILVEADASILDLVDAMSAEHAAEALTWACFTGRTGEAEELLDRGIDPMAGIKTGLAAAHWAANRGNPDTVKMLIARGVDLEQLNMHDGTVLGCTLWSAIHEPREAHAEIVEVLVEAGAKYDASWLDWWRRQEIESEAMASRIAAALERKLDELRNG